MGLFKKAKKSGKKVGKASSSAVSGAASGVVSAAGEIEKLGGKVYADHGRIEGYIAKGYSVTRAGIENAVDEVEGLIEDMAAFLSKLGIAIYKAAAEHVAHDARRLSEAASYFPPVMRHDFDSIANHLLTGRFDAAVNAVRNTMRAGGALKAFADEYSPWSRGCLTISVDLAVGASAASASGSVGIAVAIDLQRDIEACIFAGAAASLVAGANEPDGTITIGFTEGGPKDTGGPGIDLAVGSFGFGFQADLSLITKPSVGSISYSISAEEFASVAAGKPPTLDFDSASLGASYGHILQTIKRQRSSPKDPLMRDQLDRSQWVSSRGNRMVLYFLERNKKKNRDWYSVTHNGKLQQQQLRKLDKYDKHDDNVTAWSAGRKSQTASGRFSRDANELVIRGTDDVRWYRVEPSA